jgi:hypothetical protein
MSKRFPSVFGGRMGRRLNRLNFENLTNRLHCSPWFDRLIHDG